MKRIVVFSEIQATPEEDKAFNEKREAKLKDLHQRLERAKPENVDHFKLLLEMTEGATPPKKKLYGLREKDGDILIPATYAKLSDIKDNLAVFEEHFYNEKRKLIRKCGVIDITGRVIISAQYDRLRIGKDQLLIATLGKLTGIINLKNEWIIFPKYDSLRITDEGYVIVEKGRLIDKVAGVMTLDEKEIIPLQYKRIAPTGSYFKAQNQKGLYGILTVDNKTLFPLEHDNIFNISENKFMAVRGGKVGAFDIDGKVILPFEYTNDHEADVAFRILKKNGLYGVVNDNCEIVIDFKYPTCWGVRDDVACDSAIFKNDSEVVIYTNDDEKCTAEDFIVRSHFPVLCVDSEGNHFGINEKFEISTSVHKANGELDWDEWYDSIEWE